MQSDSSSGAEFDELEERYNEAKQLRADGKLDEATQTFVEVVESDHAKGEWGFRAAKQLLKLALARVSSYKFLKCNAALVSDTGLTVFSKSSSFPVMWKEPHRRFPNVTFGPRISSIFLLNLGLSSLRILQR